MTMKANGGLISLRRTITPYVGQTLILVAVTLFLTYLAEKTSDWRILLIALALMWTPFILFAVFIGMKYRVLWDGRGIVMRAAGIAERRIRFDEITSVKKELAQVTEFLSQSRPFRRIVVQGQRDGRNAFIDISVRHFRLDDIEEVLSAIRARRPDLDVPRISARGRLRW